MSIASTLTHKVGPLPLGVWLVAGGAGVFTLVRKRFTSSSAVDAPAADVPPLDPPDQGATTVTDPGAYTFSPIFDVRDFLPDAGPDVPAPAEEPMPAALPLPALLPVPVPRQAPTPAPAKVVSKPPVKPAAKKAPAKAPAKAVTHKAPTKAAPHKAPPKPKPAPKPAPKAFRKSSSGAVVAAAHWGGSARQVVNRGLF